jgi:hypothetical protein
MKKLLKVLSAMTILAAVSTAHAQQMGGPGGGQDNGGPGGGMQGGPGGGPDGGPPDPQEMMARMDRRIKAAMGVSDDTWATVQPLVDKVQQLEHETDMGPLMHGRPQRPPQDDNGGGGPGGGGPGGQDNAGLGGGGPGGGGPGGGGPGGQDNGGPGGGGPGGGPDAMDDHPQSPVESAISDLKKVLRDKSASDEKIESAMKAVEDAELKAKDDLEAARKELKAAVNLRQQAVLVALGILN